MVWVNFPFLSALSLILSFEISNFLQLVKRFMMSKPAFFAANNTFKDWMVGSFASSLSFYLLYLAQPPSEFPEAQQLLQIRASDTTVMAISLYADNEAMERASAARAKRMSNNEKTFDVVDTKTGEVTLNHKN